MLKRDELTNPNSCMSRARDDEMTFVLIGRDRAFPAAVRFWIGERLRLGKNQRDDPQIREAAECATAVEDMHNACKPMPTESHNAELLAACKAAHSYLTDMHDLSTRDDVVTQLSAAIAAADEKGR